MMTSMGNEVHSTVTVTGLTQVFYGLFSALRVHPILIAIW